MAEPMSTPSEGDVLSAIEEKLFPSEEAPSDALDQEEVVADSEDTQDDHSDSEEGEEEVEQESEVEADVEDDTLAGVLGLSDDQVEYNDDGEIIFNAKIDGEVQAVKIQDLLKSYQLEGHVNKKSMELSEQQKQFEQVASAKLGEYVEKLDVAAGLLEVLDQQFSEGMESEAMQQLKSQDPAQYLLAQSEMTQRAERLKAAAQKVRSDQAEAMQHAQQEQMQQILTKERSAMLAKNPEWSDASKMKADRDEMASFLKQYGYEENVMDSILDHRLIEVIKDARKFRQGSAEVKEKRAKPVPKFNKPGAARTKDLGKARAAKAKREKLRQSHSTNDLAAVLLDRM